VSSGVRVCVRMCVLYGEGAAVANKYCGNCGNELSPNDSFCPNCGNPVHETARVATPEADVSVPAPPQQGGGDATPPPQQAGTQQAGAPTQGRSSTGRLLVGCLAVFGLLFLLAIGLGTIGGGGGNPANSPPERAEQDEGVEGGGKDPEAKQPLQGERAKPQEGQQQQPAQQQERPTAQIGQTVTVGDVAWRVTNAQQTNQLKSQFGQFGNSKRGNFVIVDFMFTNKGNEAVTLDPISLALIDGQGRKFETDTDTFEYIPPQKDIFLTQVNPGVTQPGRVIFTVAPDTSNFTLQAGDTNFWSDKNAHIELGF
jgi:hypothetical protein